ncbi:MAG: hypothetical protein M1820_001453 [Bogoriella megaspora]|nr:MAG: hypothetical protein M1820_001453 [Bogoriella megaspora]
MGLLTTVFAGLVALALVLQVSKWRRNYQAALRMGFPVFYSPIHISSVWWMLLYPVLIPLLDKLPKRWTCPWLQVAQVWRIWKIGYQPFADVGSDTFVIATPSGNMLWSSDDTIIRNLYTQHPSIDAPVEFLSFWNVWGPTIGSVTGNEWKTHRRAVTAGFGPAMHRIVWEETQHQTKTLVSHLIQSNGSVIQVMRHWASRLALHVISSGFFNLRIEWDDNLSTKILSPGHKIGLEKALPTFIDRLAVYFMVPRRLLRWLPGKKFQEAHRSYTETTKYLEEFRASVLDNQEAVMRKQNKTILESVVLSGASSEVSGKESLLKDSVLGNIFFTLLAGHETTGGTLGFIFTLMAIYPDIQGRLQKELDELFGNRLLEEWSLERDFEALERGLAGAIQKEVLYIFNPASFIMRKTLEPVAITDYEDNVHSLPANTLTLISNAGAARNPKNWRGKPIISDNRKAALSESPALYFNPNRWLEKGRVSSNGINEMTWTAFGAGGRACPGRMFAQIELHAAVATLFKDYSLELVVDATTLRNCNNDATRAWESTRDSAIKMLYDEIEANISIGVYKEMPIRIVKRTA